MSYFSFDLCVCSEFAGSFFSAFRLGPFGTNLYLLI